MHVRNPTAIREARIAVGYSQRHLAHRCGRTQTAIYKIETGRLRRVSPDLADAIAVALRRPVEELFR